MVYISKQSKEFTLFILFASSASCSMFVHDSGWCERAVENMSLWLAHHSFHTKVLFQKKDGTVMQVALMPVNLSFSTECVKDRSACKVGQYLMGGYFKNKNKRGTKKRNMAQQWWSEQRGRGVLLIHSRNG